jgi:hypothetical protein
MDDNPLFLWKIGSIAPKDYHFRKIPLKDSRKLPSKETIHLEKYHFVIFCSEPTIFFYVAQCE